MLKIATYNIQFSLHPDSIERNLVKIANEGVSIICLQEVVVYNKDSNIISRILNRLGSNWEAKCHLGEGSDLLSMGTCILWNNKLVKNIDIKKIILPFSENLRFPEKVFSILAGGVSTPFLRRAISAEFEFK